MDKLSAAIFVALLYTVLSVGHVSGAQKDYLLKPVPFTQVHVEDRFWSPRLETNRNVTIPHSFRESEETGRINNFAIAGGLMKGKHEGYFFNDSDVYKVIEGAACALCVSPDPKLEKYVDDVIAKIAAAQEDDGYLYTARTAMTPDRMPPGGKERWSDIASGHELYCVGHLYEAAVAYYRATGKRTLLDVALKSAELIGNVFGPGKKSYPPGHQEVEIGLVKLYRLTGDEKYLNLAKFFLDQRGRPEGHRLYGEYSQDHKPVVEQDEAVGHAVRACYMYSGMADVAALTGDSTYLKALDRIWENVVFKKLYITGGIGARGGNEGFGEEYVLPNLSAYCETCAAIANALWNYRMFLTYGDAKYMNVVERVIYNGFLSGVSLEGDRFFYANPLESHGGSSRSPWFGCACCPPNVARFIPSIPGFAYAQRDDNLYITLFIAGSTKVSLDSGTAQIRQETRYPWDGAVKIAVEPETPEQEFTIHIRIPGWARNQPVPGDLYRYMNESKEEIILRVNDKPVPLEIESGFARINRKWAKGDVIELILPMPLRRVLAHEEVLDDKGRVALERGPLVYCAEGIDNKDGNVLNLLLPDDAELTSEYRENMLDGIVVVRGRASVVKRSLDGEPAVAEETVDLLAIPYYAWCHRGPSQMAVWLAREAFAAKPLPAPTIAHTSRVTVSGGGVISALTDQLEPRSSDDHSNPFFHWWPRKGTLEWVQYDFKKPEEVSVAEVYWFDDTGIGECRVPQSWRLLYKDGDEWKPVVASDAYGVEKDKYNRVTFEKVNTSGLRLEVQLQERWSAGIHEWRVQ